MKGVLLSVVLFAMVAQVFPACQGEATEIVGWVQEKLVSQAGGESEYVIIIDGTHYTVPQLFWQEVRVGDLVKYDGYQWTIVKKAGTSTLPVVVEATPMAQRT